MAHDHTPDDEIDISVDVRFAMIPYWVLLHENISPFGVRLYGVIRKHADNETGVARPSRATLAKLCRKSVKTIDRGLDELEAAGAVEVRPRWMNAAKTSFRSAPDGEHVVRAPSLYVVKSVPPRRGGGDTNVPTPVGTSKGGRDTDVPTGRAKDVAGVGTRMTQELDPPELDPEELDKEGGCVSGVPHLPTAAPVDNSPLPAESVEPATEPAAVDPPAPWCPDHPGNPGDVKCGRCKAHRLEREAFNERAARARAEAEREQIAARRRAEADEIAECAMCDEDGFSAPAVKCLHDPTAVETARRGAAKVRAALAAKSRRHSTNPQPTPSSTATARTAPESRIHEPARR